MGFEDDNVPWNENNFYAFASIQGELKKIIDNFSEFPRSCDYNSKQNTWPAHAQNNRNIPDECVPLAKKIVEVASYQSPKLLEEMKKLDGWRQGVSLRGEALRAELVKQLNK